MLLIRVSFYDSGHRNVERHECFGRFWWPNVPDVQLMQTMVKRESAAGRASVPLSQAWHVRGEGLVCCPCKTPCPCRSNAAPTYKHCENTGLIHIHRGRYGRVSLDGFNFIAVNGAMETWISYRATRTTLTDGLAMTLERLKPSSEIKAQVVVA